MSKTNPSVPLYILSLVIFVTCVYLIFHWFNWRLLLVLMLFGWAMNLSHAAELKRQGYDSDEMAKIVSKALNKEPK